MILLSLNIWGGRREVFGKLINYIKSMGGPGGVDIFCFQEVFSTVSGNAPLWSDDGQARYKLFADFCNVLPNHCGYFAPHHDRFDYNGKTKFFTSFGLATFVTKTIPVIDVGDVFVFGNRNEVDSVHSFSRSRAVQYITVLDEHGKSCTICNFHGLWNGKDKNDSDERLNQAKNIRAFLDEIPHVKILCGDFNMMPNIESLRILEKGMRNLVVEKNILTTRSDLYEKRDAEPYADYILVSDAVNVISFHVLWVEVSDHLPLEIEFSVL